MDSGFFNTEALKYFLVPYLLVLHLGLVIDLALGRLQRKRITFSFFIWICGVIAGFILALFVSLMEGLKDGTQVRALSLGFTSSTMILALFFGGSALVTQQIANSIMKFYRAEISEDIVDELRNSRSKGEGNGS
jgi:hypothetical protein